MSYVRNILLGAFIASSIVICGCAAGEEGRNASGGDADSPLEFDARPSEPEAASTEKEMAAAEGDDALEPDPGAASTGGPHLEWLSAIVDEAEDQTITATIVDPQSKEKKTVRIQVAAWVDKHTLDRIHNGTEVRFSFVTGSQKPIPSEVVAYEVEIAAE